MRKIETECDALLIGSTATKMWFPHFRTPKDSDLYVKPQFVKQFIDTHNGLEIKRHTDRKFVALYNGQMIDFTIDADGSWINPIMQANRAGKRIQFNNTIVTLATPTSLRLIKEVLSCWRLNWRKNISDYIFLSTIVKSQYSNDELKAIEVGMAGFKKCYKDEGVPAVVEGRHTIDELEDIVNIADLTSRIMIKDKILEYL